jgi:hypothetical protein
MTPEQIAASLTPEQRNNREAVMKKCCGDPICWARNDLDGWLFPGCAKCAGMAEKVQAIIDKEKQMPATTDEQTTKAAKAVRAAVAAYNAAAEEASRLDLRVELRTLSLQTMRGDVALLEVQIFKPI